MCILWALILFSHPQYALNFVNSLSSGKARDSAKIITADQIVSVQYCKDFDGVETLPVLPSRHVKVESNGVVWPLSN